MKTVWTFKTASFHIDLKIEEEFGIRYDGDDPGGEIQAKLESGEYISFTSKACVSINGIEIGNDFLCGSIYDRFEMSEFWTMHRSPDPRHRNCSIMRDKHPAGPNVSVGHYFPDMVRTAIREARTWLADLPKLRNTES